MPIFKILVSGSFHNKNGKPIPVSVPNFGSKIAGFYTTRIVRAIDLKVANETAANEIHDELSSTIGKNGSAYTLEIDEIEELREDAKFVQSRGFSFFTSD